METCAACPTTESNVATHQQSGYTSDTALGAAQTHKSDPIPEGLQSIQTKQGKILEILGSKAEIHAAYSKPGFTNHLLSTQVHFLLSIQAELLLASAGVFPK